MTLCIPHAVRAGQIGLDMKQGDEPLGLTQRAGPSPQKRQSRCGHFQATLLSLTKVCLLGLKSAFVRSCCRPHS